MREPQAQLPGPTCPGPARPEPTRPGYLHRVSRQTGLPRRVLVMAALALALIVLLAFALFQSAQHYRR